MTHQPSSLASEASRPSAAGRGPRWPRWVAAGVCGLLAALAGTAGVFLADPAKAPAALGRLIEDINGANPHPVTLVRPPHQPLSQLALLGREVFFDRTLSASGRQSCASCHNPDDSFGPADRHDVEMGGPDLTRQGLRPPPSLAYLHTQAAFNIGPAGEDLDAPIPLDQLVQQAKAQPHLTKVAGGSTANGAMVPIGGLFWDGRADALMDQAKGPMMDPNEMANKDLYAVAAKIAVAPYADRFKPLFGPDILTKPGVLFLEAMSAVSRYQIEETAFHRFDSKYDHWLEGKARLSHAEMRGMRLFNDPAKGNCAGCHLSQPTKDGQPPLFTDTEYEALGVPRNRRLVVNRDPAFFDLGLCGPIRKDLAGQPQYCGMFLTPTLRNTARRGVYFHNGVYHDLRQVLNFYNLRDVAPGRIYPRDAAGRVVRADDLPPRLHANIDVADAPLDRKPGDPPALSDAEIGDIIAFLHTLDDGDGGTGAVPAGRR